MMLSRDGLRAHIPDAVLDQSLIAPGALSCAMCA